MSRRLFTVLAIAMIATGALNPLSGAAATAPCTLETFAGPQPARDDHHSGRIAASRHELGAGR